MNPKEIGLTELCHKPSLELLYGLLAKLPSMQQERAIEIGCGDGRFTVDALLGRFSAVDLFDQCSKAISKVKVLKRKHKSICNIERATMQGYIWKDNYNAIFSRWSIGYLKDQELVQILS